jgi:hypothetical protein
MNLLIGVTPRFVVKSGKYRSALHGHIPRRLWVVLTAMGSSVQGRVRTSAFCRLDHLVAVTRTGSYQEWLLRVDDRRSLGVRYRL